MGNNFTKSQQDEQKGGGRTVSDEELSKLGKGDILDIIVAHYILTMNMESLSDLNKAGKCQEITQLTNEAFTKSATTGDILTKYNEMFQQNKTEYDPSMCGQVVAIYMNIAKVYSVIVSAIRPSYEYKNERGEVETGAIFDENVDVFGEDLALSKLSFCGAKIQSLTGSGNVCSQDTNSMEAHLDIPELYDLYCDTEYDLETGTFVGMSDETREEYRKNLQSFYTIFTGKTSLPDNIKRFGDIPLTDYNKSNLCKYRNFNADDCYDELGKKITCPPKKKSSQPQTSKETKERLLETYATNLRNMVSNVNVRQSKLTIILNELFVFDNTIPDQVRVSNTVTADRVKELTRSVRELVNQINLSCSIDYMNGIKVYEAIVELQALDTSMKQIEYIKQLREIIKNPGSV